MQQTYNKHCYICTNVQTSFVRVHIDWISMVNYKSPCTHSFIHSVIQSDNRAARQLVSLILTQYVYIGIIKESTTSLLIVFVYVWIVASELEWKESMIKAIYIRMRVKAENVSKNNIQKWIYQGHSICIGCLLYCRWSYSA